MLAVSLTACAPAASDTAEEAPAAAATAEAAAAATGDLPGAAELQAAFDKTCPGQPRIASASCTALDDPTEFKCSYTQEPQQAGATSETIIAKDADTFVLIDLPNNCQVQ
ncbi:hypothetical protein OPU67_03080 [Erythrobacter sp. WG]|nr:hypothetical protein [Erythrobacter sp. WG]